MKNASIPTLSGETIRHLMRKNHLTLRGIAHQWDFTLKYVRQVRQHGVQGAAYVQDWLELLTGSPA